MTDKSVHANSVVVESLDYESRGIAHTNGKVIFIEGALTGERVTYSSYRKKTSFEIAQLGQVIKPTFMRVQPKCKHFGVCGGCSMQHMDARAQVAAKQRISGRQSVAHRQGQGPDYFAADLRSVMGLPTAGAAFGAPCIEEGQDTGRLSRKAWRLCGGHAALRNPDT